MTGLVLPTAAAGGAGGTSLRILPRSEKSIRAQLPCSNENPNMQGPTLPLWSAFPHGGRYCLALEQHTAYLLSSRLRILVVHWTTVAFEKEAGIDALAARHPSRRYQLHLHQLSMPFPTCSSPLRKYKVQISDDNAQIREPTVAASST